MSRERAERQVKIGKAYFAAYNDSLGYPNGLPLWHEMPVSQKYHFCVLGCDFIERAGKEGLVPRLDLGPHGAYGEGECAELVALLEETHAREVEEYEAWRADLLSRPRRRAAGSSGTASQPDRTPGPSTDPSESR